MRDTQSAHEDAEPASFLFDARGTIGSRKNIFNHVLWANYGFQPIGAHFGNFSHLFYR
ncbi:hypothetical protein [Thioclava sp. GXIMD4215]|uniref:hypothetical protein n=1 Tax=Thioclava sp. GXIMD4215 TaxID=3131928 RepID=UPI00311AE101